MLFNEDARMKDLLIQVRDKCLTPEDDGQIGVTEEPHIPGELFDEICEAINATEQGSLGKKITDGAAFAEMNSRISQTIRMNINSYRISLVFVDYREHLDEPKTLILDVPLEEVALSTVNPIALLVEKGCGQMGWGLKTEWRTYNG